MSVAGNVLLQNCIAVNTLSPEATKNPPEAVVPHDIYFMHV